MENIVTTLNEGYALATKPDISNWDFLIILNDYMKIVENEEITKKIIKAMYENRAAEIIKEAKESVYYHRDLLSIQKEEDDKDSRYPVYEYESLIEACADFLHVFEQAQSRESALELGLLTNKFTKSELEHTKTFSAGGMLTMTQHLYKKALPILHKKLMEELEISKQRGGVFSNFFDYDPNNGILFFQNKEVPMNSRKIPTNAHYLLSYLFKTSDPFEKHFIDEMNEEKALLEEKPWKSFYDASMDVQAKVEKITGIADLLDFSTGKGLYVRLNPKYSLRK